MGKAGGVCTRAQYREIVETINNGYGLTLPNPVVATAIVVEANTGLRMGDVLSLRRSSFVETANGHRFDVVEHKTGKKRTFLVQKPLYDYLMAYADRYVADDNLFFPIEIRTVQKHIRSACDYLGEEYADITSHSFRKMFASQIYYANGCDVELVRRLLQHSSSAVTMRYIGVSDRRIEDALNGVVNIV